MINGSTDASAAIARALLPSLATPATIIESPVADKAHAINEVFYLPGVGAALTVFVDGYATINEGAMRAFEAALRDHPAALGATGLAGNGRSEIKTRDATLRGGVIHGQLYALTSAFLAELTAKQYRLPAKLYRGDGLIGSMLCTALDPVNNTWDNARLIGVEGAVFLIDPLSLFRPRDLRRQFRRKVRQMRGRLENAAIKQIINRDGYGALPADADDMIAAYLARHALPAVGLADRPFLHLALRHHRKTRAAAA